MGASSVTGVGVGYADNQKGAKNMSIGVERLVGPHIVVAGTAVAGTTLVLPLLKNAVGNYIVLCQDTTANHSVSAVLAFTANSTTVAFTGTGSDVIHYAIVRTGTTLGQKVYA